MDRRSLLKGLVAGAAAVPASQGVVNDVLAAVETAGSSPAADSAAPGTVPIAPPDPGYFVPGRFQGKTIVITGFARGMGQAAAIRAAREGANVVGIDWLPDEAERTAQLIARDNGRIAYMVGNVAKTIDCDRMVALAVEKFGGLDFAINNAGVMDGVYSGDPIDYATQ